MYSRIFLAKVDAIEDSLEGALPILRKKFGESLTLDEVRTTIGTRKLLEEATNACLRDNCASIRGTPQQTGSWMNIQELYENALAIKKQNSEETCEVHGTVPYAHGYCPFCTE